MKVLKVKKKFKNKDKYTSFSLIWTNFYATVCKVKELYNKYKNYCQQQR